MKRKLKETVTPDYDGVTAKIFLKSKMKVSGSLLKKLKASDDGILLNGERIFADKRLTTGDVLEISVEDSVSSENILPVAGEINIIFEDEDLLIVNKPYNLPVHPSRGHPYDSLANRVAFYFRENKKDNFVFRCVTRLDKDTSGVCVIAKNSYAHAVISKEMRRGETEKTYKAAVSGTLEENSGIIEKNIRRIPNTATIKREVCPDGDGEYALTEYKALERKNKYTLLEIKLRTGRTHQIRVHLASVGFPIVGDWLYGSESERINRQALHCESVVFSHPVTGERLKFTAPLPSDIQNLFL